MMAETIVGDKPCTTFTCIDACIRRADVRIHAFRQHCVLSRKQQVEQLNSNPKKSSLSRKLLLKKQNKKSAAFIGNMLTFSPSSYRKCLY